MMRLLYVTDNGFYKEGNKVYYDSSNKAHINNLRPFFDEFIVIARNNTPNKNYSEIGEKIEVHLVNKKNIYGLISEVKKLLPVCDAAICYHINGSIATSIIKKSGKVIIGYNGGDSYDVLRLRGDLKGKILAPIVRYLYKYGMGNADFGHYPAQFLAERYPAKGKMLICSGVDIKCDETNLSSRIKKVSALATNKKIVMGLTGHTMNGVKGIDFAIEALSMLPERYVLEVVGRGDPGNLKDLAIQKEVEDRIVFLGVKQSGEEMINWLDSLDIYIQPSRVEGLPRATLEAMSRGCPCVVSNAGALPEIIDHEYVYDFKNPKALAKKILAITNENEMTNQAKRNFLTSKQFERSVRDQKYNEFYTKVIEEINNRKHSK